MISLYTLNEVRFHASRKCYPLLTWLCAEWRINLLAYMKAVKCHQINVKIIYLLNQIYSKPV